MDAPERHPMCRSTVVPVVPATDDVSRDLDATFAELIYLGAPELADAVDVLRLFDPDPA